jgi:hypothetical protein
MTTAGASMAPPGPPPATAGSLHRLQLRQLAAWYAATGERQANETFGEVVARAASEQLGKPYDGAAARRPWEKLACRFDAFNCETLVELSVALARCIWLDVRQPECFVAELARLRYRHGIIDGYGSQLHYFEEWLQDNAQRGAVRLLAEELGGRFISRPFFYMSRHPKLYLPLRDAAAITAVLQAEERLAHTPLAVVERAHVAQIQGALCDGDIIASVGDGTPGLLVRHAGIVRRSPRFGPQLLHASSEGGRVLLTPKDLVHYLQRHPSRRGIMVARPLPPLPPPAAIPYPSKGAQPPSF